MLIPLLLGCAVTLTTMSVEVGCVVIMVRYLLGLQQSGRVHSGIGLDAGILMIVLSILFIGHLVQIGVWAALFVVLDEFEDFAWAFYHSAVNFTSLGYGDITMSKEWRLLGALEAANGVLMLGLSTGTLMSVMTWMFGRRIQDNDQQD